MLRLLMSTLVAGCLNGQTTAPPDLGSLVRPLREAILNNDLVMAADLAARLDEGVQARMRASLVSDARQRIEEVLRWLPPDTETLMVQQEPMVLKAGDSAQMFYGRPARQHALDRLLAINQGQFYRHLNGKTVRLAVAGMRYMRSRGIVTPSLMPNADVAYFYFFTEPLDAASFGPPQESLEGHSCWNGTATILASDSWTPGLREAPKREDETWLALARSDLLVMTSNRDFLVQVLERMTRAVPGRALPDTLPEWAQVDRKASFWGLRHYSDPGERKDTSNPRAKDETGAPQDTMAQGITMQFYVDQDAVDIRYLGDHAHWRLVRMARDFKQDQPSTGVWRLKSNIRERGDFPFHFGAGMLGFGDYR